VQVGQRQHLVELLAQPVFHFVFNGINAVLGEAAGLDVAVKQHYLVACFRHFVRGKQASGTRSDHENASHWFSF